MGLLSGSRTHIYCWSVGSISSGSLKKKDNLEYDLVDQEVWVPDHASRFFSLHGPSREHM
eukprot:12917987-Prorocentrum_lima.AAC.1